MEGWAPRPERNTLQPMIRTLGPRPGSKDADSRDSPPAHVPDAPEVLAHTQHFTHQ